MDDVVAQLVLAYIDEDRAWVHLVTSVSKRLASVLDKDHQWEQHFQLPCANFLLPTARFRLVRYVECKHTMPYVYDPSISHRYKVNLIFRHNGPCRARQLLGQFFLISQQIDYFFPADDVPGAEFVWDEATEASLACNSVQHAGDIFVAVIEDQDAEPIVGSLETLYGELATGFDSDESLDCSECGSF